VSATSLRGVGWLGNVIYNSCKILLDVVGVGRLAGELHQELIVGPGAFIDKGYLPPIGVICVPLRRGGINVQGVALEVGRAGAAHGVGDSHGEKGDGGEELYGSHGRDHTEMVG
jgi:hypothetical protein